MLATLLQFHGLINVDVFPLWCGEWWGANIQFVLQEGHFNRHATAGMGGWWIVYLRPDKIQQIGKVVRPQITNIITTSISEDLRHYQRGFDWIQEIWFRKCDFKHIIVACIIRGGGGELTVVNIAAYCLSGSSAWLRAHTFGTPTPDNFEWVSYQMEKTTHKTRNLALITRLMILLSLISC